MNATKIALAVAALTIYCIIGRLTAVWWAGSADVFRCMPYVAVREGRSYASTQCEISGLFAGVAWPVFLPVKVGVTIADQIAESITND